MRNGHIHSRIKIYGEARRRWYAQCEQTSCGTHAATSCVQQDGSEQRSAGYVRGPAQARTLCIAHVKPCLFKNKNGCLRQNVAVAAALYSRPQLTLQRAERAAQQRPVTVGQPPLPTFSTALRQTTAQVQPVRVIITITARHSGRHKTNGGSTEGCAAANSCYWNGINAGNGATTSRLRRETAWR